MLTEQTIKDNLSTAQQGQDALSEGGIEEAYEALVSIREAMQYILENYKVLFIPKGVGGE